MAGHRGLRATSQVWARTQFAESETILLEPLHEHELFAASVKAVLKNHDARLEAAERVMEALATKRDDLRSVEARVPCYAHIEESAAVTTR